MTNDSRSKNQKPRPLEGIRIIEFGPLIAAPGAPAILGDLGADVVKIESLTGLDQTTCISASHAILTADRS